MATCKQFLSVYVCKYSWFSKGCSGHQELAIEYLAFWANRATPWFFWVKASFLVSNSPCPKQPLLNQIYVFRYFDNPENTFAVSYNTKGTSAGRWIGNRKDVLSFIPSLGRIPVVSGASNLFLFLSNLNLFFSFLCDKVTVTRCILFH